VKKRIQQAIDRLNEEDGRTYTAAAKKFEVPEGRRVHGIPSRIDAGGRK
jgi:hypothetical protein